MTSILPSQPFSAWGKWNAVAADNQAAAPDGTMTAARVTITGPTGEIISPSFTPPHGGVVDSICIKQGTQGTQVQLVEDKTWSGITFVWAKPSGNFQALANGWFKIWFNDPTIAAHQIRVYGQNAGDNFYVADAEAVPLVAQPAARMPSFATPFANNSLWNVPISELSPVYSDPSLIQNVHLRDPALGYTWASDSASLVNSTLANAPLATWKYVTLNKTQVGGGWSGNGTVQIATPEDISFIGNDDYSIFNDPASSHFWELWLGAHDAATGGYSANYMVENDWTGSGWGKPGVSAGIRAAGCSLLGGIITQAELTALMIQHALPMVLSATLLKAGKTQAEQFVYPAVTADSGSVQVYTGTIPMGAHFALPPASALDLSSAGASLTPGGLSLARAYQNYGGYVVDTAPNTVSLAQTSFAGWPASEADMNWIRARLVMVSVPPAT